MLAICCLFFSLAVNTRAALQFDVFPGYDSAVREAGFFPMVFEVFNDGPSFNAVLEISSGNVGADQVRLIPVELPTNTRKRIVAPVFAPGSRMQQWSVRLLDQKGNVQAERAGLPIKIVPWEGIIVGALPRTFAGMPTLPEGPQNRNDLKPHVARFQPELFPDNAIALEGLDSLYLNTEKALELKVNQIAALLAWLHSGGHLIVMVEQLADVNATPWLQQLLPCALNSVVNVTVDDEFLRWLQTGTAETPTSLRTKSRQRQFGGSFESFQNIEADPSMVGAEMPIATGTVREGGRVALSMGGKPLIVEAPRGRGRITLLTFNPEREPFRSWKQRTVFWGKLVGVTPEWYSTMNSSTFGGVSMDGVFGALIDSRQVRKLPVEWLLLLLVVYLVVIGPFDQWWLKRINRQMLTWVTFPAYVVFFSLLIYYIGYKLRAGETEWNEIHIVDVLPRNQDEAELRGRTYASIYSSANASYQLANEQTATLRGELLDLYGGGKEGSRAKVEQQGNGFKAEIYVPVWTSLLYVNDWLQSAPVPLKAKVQRAGGDEWEATVENLLPRPLTEARIVVQGRVYELGTLPPQETKTVKLPRDQGVLIQTFVQQHGASFQSAVQQRRNPLGDNASGHLDNGPLTAMAASFTSQLPKQAHERGFVSPNGLDLMPLVERGDSVLFAWDANNSFTKPINQFQPPRSQRQTLLRLSIPTGNL